MSKETQQFGDIVSIGITSNDCIQIEFVGYGINDVPTEFIVLNKRECEKIAKLYKIIEDDKKIP